MRGRETTENEGINLPSKRFPRLARITVLAAFGLAAAK